MATPFAAAPLGQQRFRIGPASRSEPRTPAATAETAHIAAAAAAVCAAMARVVHPFSSGCMQDPERQEILAAIEQSFYSPRERSGRRVLHRACEVSRMGGHCPSELRRDIDAILRRNCPFIVDTRVSEQSCILATQGCTLLGQPDLVAVWPSDLAEAARAILHAWIDDVMEERQPMAPGQAKNCTMTDTAYAVSGNVTPLYRMHVPMHSLTRKWGAAPSLCDLTLVSDMREDVDVVGGATSGITQLPHGLVFLPVATRSWAEAGHDGHIARLVDPSGAIGSARRVLAPSAACEALGISPKKLRALLGQQRALVAKQLTATLAGTGVTGENGQYL